MASFGGFLARAVSREKERRASNVSMGQRNGRRYILVVRLLIAAWIVQIRTAS
jgi:hypothetical protein